MRVLCHIMAGLAVMIFCAGGIPSAQAANSWVEYWTGRKAAAPAVSGTPAPQQVPLQGQAPVLGGPLTTGAAPAIQPYNPAAPTPTPTYSSDLTTAQKQIEAQKQAETQLMILRLQGDAQQKAVARAAVQAQQEVYRQASAQAAAAAEIALTMQDMPVAGVMAPGLVPVAAAPVAARAPAGTAGIRPYVPAPAPVQEWDRQTKERMDAEKWKSIRVTPSSVLATPPAP